METTQVFYYPTPACPNCGKHSIIPLGKTSFDLWQEGTLIQKAFPHMSASERETLISGFHPDCWESVFGGEEE